MEWSAVVVKLAIAITYNTTLALAINEDGNDRRRSACDACRYVVG